MLRRFYGSYWAYFLVYNFYFLSWALFSTLISLYMLELGFSAKAVGMVVSLSFLASALTQPLIGYLNNKWQTKPLILGIFGLMILFSLLMFQARTFTGIAIAYSVVLLLINGLNPILETLATRSPYPYGRIRIWGTIGYALGAQLAGLIYQYISPQAIYLFFCLTILLATLGVLFLLIPGQSSPSEQQEASTQENGYKGVLGNAIFVGYTGLILVYSGVMNAGHTYVPAMLEDAGLSVSIATTVVSIAVLFELPVTYFSHLFMDRFTSKQLLTLSFLLFMGQYAVYSLDLGIFPMILATLLAKHISGMLFIMVNLKIVNSLVGSFFVVMGLSIVQAARSLGSIIMQLVAGEILNHYHYHHLNLFILATVALVFVLFLFLPLPMGTDQKLFSR